MPELAWPRKDPANIEPFFVVWCDETGLNDGSALDNGELQGATIATSVWTVPAGITKDSDTTNAANLHGVSYAIDTVATIWLSGGTADNTYSIVNTITTSDSRTLRRTVTIRVEDL